jgi:hypothetical protein
LLALGLTAAEIRAMLESGELVLVYEGVYRHAVWPVSFHSTCVAISAADSKLVVCCGGGARVWEFRGCTKVGLHATTTATSVPIAVGALVHRCPVMPDHHVVERPDGIRVTSPARTVFDLSRHLVPVRLESVVEQGLRRGQFDIAELYQVGQLLCTRGRAGSKLFADVLTSRPAWRRPVDSHPELVLVKVLRDRGVSLDTQVAVTLPNGRTIHPDLGDPSIGFFIEIDDHEWHGGRLAATYDAQRDRQVRLIGGRIERVSTDEVRQMSSRFVADLVDAYRQHRSASLRSA